MSHFSLYQIVHTLEGRIFHLEEHLNLLFEAYYEVFGSGVKLVAKQVEAQINDCIKRSRCPRGVSLFVKISIGEDGTLQVAEYERSLYCGYTLRCISPRAAMVDFNLPYSIYPTSTREELTQFAALEARKKGGDVALRCHNGVVDLINGAQIFGVFDNMLITERESHSVEHKMAKEAAQRADIKLFERPLRADEILTLDELFYVDHYGVTAIKSCAGQHYMTIVASVMSKLLAGK